MSLLLFATVFAIVSGFVGFQVWRRWIEPWRELEELVSDITTSKKPRKFLITGNERANVLGLALERFPIASASWR